VKHYQDGLDVTVVECARRIMDKDWEGIPVINIRTLGYALIMIEATRRE
jgi:hypothetical protein